MKIPKLCRHRGRGLGYVTHQGREIYFGPWPDGAKGAPKQVREAYAAFVISLVGGQIPHEAKVNEITVSELCASFLDWIEEELGRNERSNYSAILVPVLGLFGATAASDFGPVKLRRVQQWLVETPIESEALVEGKFRTVRNSRTRSGINISISRIRRIWKWGVSREMVRPDVLLGLQSLESLELGRTPAPEAKARVAVEDTVIGETLPHLHPILAAMVRLQRLTGMRPGEVCAMTGAQMEQGPLGWLYKPEKHKNKHRGKPRHIALSPAAIEILRPFMVPDPDQPLFRPCDVMAHRSQAKRSTRKTPVQPSQRTRRVEAPMRAPRQAYDSHSYGRAIATICKRHGIPQWSPNQLRKTAINEVAQKAGERHAQAFAGHANAEVTKRFYLEQDIRLAQEAAKLVEGK